MEAELEAEMMGMEVEAEERGAGSEVDTEVDTDGEGGEAMEVEEEGAGATAAAGMVIVQFETAGGMRRGGLFELSLGTTAAQLQLLADKLQLAAAPPDADRPEELLRAEAELARPQAACGFSVAGRRVQGSLGAALGEGASTEEVVRIVFAPRDVAGAVEADAEVETDMPAGGVMEVETETEEESEVETEGVADEEEEWQEAEWEEAVVAPEEAECEAEAEADEADEATPSGGLSLPKSFPQARGASGAPTESDLEFLRSLPGALEADRPKVVVGKKKPPLLKEAELRRASFVQLLKSRNYDHDPDGAVARWKQLRKDFAESEEAKKEAAEAKAAARREAEAQAAAARHFNQTMDWYAKDEAAAASRRGGVTARPPSPERPTVLRLHTHVPKIKITGAKAKAVKRKLQEADVRTVRVKLAGERGLRRERPLAAAAAPLQEWAACDVCDKWHKVETAWPEGVPFLCRNVGKRCPHK